MGMLGKAGFAGFVLLGGFLSGGVSAANSEVFQKMKISIGIWLIATTLVMGIPTLVLADFDAGRKAFRTGDFANAFREFKPLAEEGHAGAQFNLGIMYFKGKGVTKDIKEALKWYRMAAEQNNIEAQASLGSMYYSSKRTTRNISEAAKWLRKAAERGHAGAQAHLGFMYYSSQLPGGPADAAKYFQASAEQGDWKAQYYLARMYYKGLGVAKDLRVAAIWFRKAAEQGYAKAQFYLGNSYHLGQGVPQDSRQAIKWFRKASEQGDARAQYMLGNEYDDGGVLPRDDGKAFELYSKAAEQDLPFAQYSLGIMYLYGRGVQADSRKGAVWFRRAAEQGHAKAQFNLGYSHYIGQGVSQDFRLALMWFRKAADQGDAKAQHNLGRMYFTGVEVAQSDDLAVFWYKKAANQGNAESQYLLGVNYYLGRGVAKSESQAVKWISRSAKQGHPKAQLNMSVRYGEGIGVDKDDVKALKWLYLSSKQGVGAKLLDKQIKKMSPVQVSQAKQLAKTWKPNSSDEMPNEDFFAADDLDKTLERIRKAHYDAVAILIGNKEYGKNAPEVPFAHKDANEVRHLLIRRLGYRTGNIIDLRDATYNQLAGVFGKDKTHEGQLFDWLKSDASDVFVFYSGHGVPGLKDKRPYLLPVDGDANRAEITGYPLDVLYKNLAMLPAKSVTVFIDACFSGDSPQGMIVKSASGISLEAKLPKSAKSMTIITAAQGDQLASWDEKAKHGLFTKHLLEALEGKADSKRYGDGDGKVSLAEVRNYLDQEMTYQARRRFGRTQKASVRGDGDTVLATVLDLPTEEDTGIEEMDAHYKALTTANIRSGPGTSHDIVGKLEVNQSVNVTGKVIGKNWFRLGDGTFVFGDLLGAVN